jgi:hypothetical protein
MALIEALALGAKVISLRLPGFENIQPFVSRGDITPADAVGNLTKELSLARVAPGSRDYFAPQVLPEKLVEILMGEVDNDA